MSVPFVRISFVINLDILKSAHAIFPRIQMPLTQEHYRKREKGKSTKKCDSKIFELQAFVQLPFNF